jgi:hypothetical protein
MNEIVEQDSRYPEWLKAWNAKAAEIDQHIIDFFQGKERTAGNMEELRGSVQRWWNDQPLSEKAREECQAGCADGNYFGQKLDSRVKYLEQEGRLDGAKRTGGATGQ